MATDSGTATVDVPPPPPPPPPPVESESQKSADLQSSRVPPDTKSEPQGLEPRGLEPTADVQKGLDDFSAAKAERQGDVGNQDSADLQSSRVPPPDTQQPTAPDNQPTAPDNQQQAQPPDTQPTAPDTRPPSPDTPATPEPATPEAATPEAATPDTGTPAPDRTVSDERATGPDDVTTTAGTADGVGDQTPNTADQQSRPDSPGEPLSEQQAAVGNQDSIDRQSNQVPPPDTQLSTASETQPTASDNQQPTTLPDTRSPSPDAHATPDPSASDIGPEAHDRTVPGEGVTETPHPPDQHLRSAEPGESALEDQQTAVPPSDAGSPDAQTSDAGTPPDVNESSNAPDGDTALDVASPLDSDPVPSVVKSSDELAGMADKPAEDTAGTREDARDYLNELRERGYELQGDPDGLVDGWHPQGQNDLFIDGTCGLVSAEGVLKQAGLDVTENSVLHEAVAQDLCCMDPPEMSASGAVVDRRGGTNESQREQLLAHYGVDSVTAVDQDLDGLAAAVESGNGVIAAVNSGALWNSENDNHWGQPNQDGSLPHNHAVHVTGTARSNGELVGFIVNDSSGQPATLVSTDRMRECWQEAGGVLNIARVK